MTKMNKIYLMTKIGNIQIHFLFVYFFPYYL